MDIGIIIPHFGNGQSEDIYEFSFWMFNLKYKWYGGRHIDSWIIGLVFMLILASRMNLGIFSLWVIVEAIEKGCKMRTRLRIVLLGALVFQQRKSDSCCWMLQRGWIKQRLRGDSWIWHLWNYEKPPQAIVVEW